MATCFSMLYQLPSPCLQPTLRFPIASTSCFPASGSASFTGLLSDLAPLSALAGWAEISGFWFVGFGASCRLVGFGLAGFGLVGFCAQLTGTVKANKQKAAASRTGRSFMTWDFILLPLVRGCLGDYSWESQLSPNISTRLDAPTQPRVIRLVLRSF